MGGVPRSGPAVNGRVRDFADGNRELQSLRWNASYTRRLIKPANFRPGEKYPAVVMVYGGPGVQEVRNSWSGATWDQVLAQRGFVIWQLDNRGSAGRGHAFETPLFRQFGKAELADQLDGIRYLVAQGFVDPARIGIHGWSYGGYMTLYSLLNAPDMFRAGIAGAPVTNWRNYDTIYTERYLGLAVGECGRISGQLSSRTSRQAECQAAYASQCRG